MTDDERTIAVNMLGDILARMLHRMANVYYQSGRADGIAVGFQAGQAQPQGDIPDNVSEFKKREPDA